MLYCVAVFMGLKYAVLCSSIYGVKVCCIV